MKLPKMIEIISKYIHSIGYNKKKNIVFVKFLNESVYIYKDVPLKEYEELINSKQIGVYFPKFRTLFEYEKIKEKTTIKSKNNKN